MTDILIQEENSGGELIYINKDLAAASLYENMPYLAMFGGDSWFMNDLLTGDDSIRFTARTERICRETTLNSAGRLIIQDAVIADLQFLTENIPGSTLSVTVIILSDDAIQIDVLFNGKLFTYLLDTSNPRARICPVVTGLMVDAIFSDHIKFEWLDNIYSYGFEWAINTTGIPPESGTFVGHSVTQTVRWLDSDTLYYIYVRTKCDDGFFSAWTSVSATTSAMPVYLFTLPESTPTNYAAIMLYTLADGVNPDINSGYYLFPGFTDTDKDDYVTVANSAYGADGTFSYTGNDFYYTNAVGQNYTLVAAVEVLTQQFRLEQSVDPVISTTMKFAVRGVGVSVWVSYGAGQDYYHYNDASVHVIEAILSPVGSASFEVIVFTNTNIGALIFYEDGSIYPIPTSKLLDIGSGTFLPSSLTSLEIRGCDSFGSMSAGLARVPIDFCTHLAPMFIQHNASLAGFSNQLFVTPNDIVNWIVAYNAMTTTVLDDLINDFVANSWDSFRAVDISTHDQSTGDMPSAASLAARNAIIAAGGTITM